jgi:hypothetical protein
MPEQFYVYIFYDPSKFPTLVPMYVGRSKENRRGGQQYLLHSNLYDGRSITNKLRELIEAGYDPQTVRLPWTFTRKEASAVKKHLIKTFGQRCLNTGPLYNMNSGARHVVTPECRAKREEIIRQGAEIREARCKAKFEENLKLELQAKEDHERARLEHARRQLETRVRVSEKRRLKAALKKKRRAQKLMDAFQAKKAAKAAALAEFRKGLRHV